MIPLEKPHRPIVCNSMWALTDFTDANGATRLVPGSHTKPNPDYGGTYETIPAEMKKGSVLIWDGSLWHGGGANRTARTAHRHRDELLRRLHPPAGEPAARSCARARQDLPARLQELVGYGVYQGLIGHIDKKSPAQLLNGGGDVQVDLEQDVDDEEERFRCAGPGEPADARRRRDRAGLGTDQPRGSDRHAPRGGGRRASICSTRRRSIEIARASSAKPSTAGCRTGFASPRSAA